MQSEKKNADTVFRARSKKGETKKITQKLRTFAREKKMETRDTSRLSPSSINFFSISYARAEVENWHYWLMKGTAGGGRTCKNIVFILYLVYNAEHDITASHIPFFSSHVPMIFTLDPRPLPPPFEILLLGLL